MVMVLLSSLFTNLFISRRSTGVGAFVTLFKTSPLSSSSSSLTSTASLLPTKKNKDRRNNNYIAPCMLPLPSPITTSSSLSRLSSHGMSSSSSTKPSPLSSPSASDSNNNNSRVVGREKQTDDIIVVPASDECPLSYTVGPYSAAEIISIEEEIEKEGSGGNFLNKLERAVAFFTANDFNSCWIRIPVSRSSLIEDLTRDAVTTSSWAGGTADSIDDEEEDVDKGNKDKGKDDGGKEDDNGMFKFDFELHHTDVKSQTIVMKKWLRKGTEDKVPPFATHQVGVAGFVLNDSNEILLVKEWTGSPTKRKPTKQWKMPGGLLDVGESFEIATCREVYEETGIRCDFESVLTFWHRHGLTFGKSDLYYVCLLKPKSEQQQQQRIKTCPDEISDARWMPINEFVQTQNHPLITHVLKHNFGIDFDGSTFYEEERIEPIAEMPTGDNVQWPNREPYPTYTSKVRARKRK